MIPPLPPVVWGLFYSRVKGYLGIDTINIVPLTWGLWKLISVYGSKPPEFWAMKMPAPPFLFLSGLNTSFLERSVSIKKKGLQVLYQQPLSRTVFNLIGESVINGLAFK